MDNNVCQITIDGDDYYIPCDRIRDLYFDGTYLINVSSSTITMRSYFDPDTSYPYIQCGSMGVCSLRSAYNNYTEVRSNFSYYGDTLKIVDYSYLIFIVLFITLGVRLIWKR